MIGSVQRIIKKIPFFSLYLFPVCPRSTKHKRSRAYRTYSRIVGTNPRRTSSTEKKREKDKWKVRAARPTETAKDREEHKGGIHTYRRSRIYTYTYVYILYIYIRNQPRREGGEIMKRRWDRKRQRIVVPRPKRLRDSRPRRRNKEKGIGWMADSGIRRYAASTTWNV